MSALTTVACSSCRFAVLGVPVVRAPSARARLTPPLGLPSLGLPPLGLPSLGLPPLRLPPLGLPPLGLRSLGLPPLDQPSSPSIFIALPSAGSNSPTMVNGCTRLMSNRFSWSGPRRGRSVLKFAVWVCRCFQDYAGPPALASRRALGGVGQQIALVPFAISIATLAQWSCWREFQ